ncbi:hypothetical protein CROQUDRAFT_433612 [Cronartium quercuum f. sp. fusiforme G11]|uniref:Uncharacterized protein n=1 Tax=Cronartium quercuum f. sp. fusiforme G11 TaxID=708437 RepID=A0A9P6NR03_9BASI|nr:hypothetical protein CROQUDRAFT_433612 [Cronartium quercuum f. sp. fusiforme G11]
MRVCRKKSKSIKSRRLEPIGKRLLAKEDLARTIPPGPVTACVSTSAYGNEEIDAGQPALLGTILSSHRALRKAALARHFTALSPRLLPHLFPLTVPRSVDLLVFWRTTTSGRSGHHHVADLRLGASADLVSPILSTVEGKAGGMYAESQAQQRRLVEEWARSEFGRSDDPIQIQLSVEGGDCLDWNFNKLGSVV